MVLKVQNANNVKVYTVAGEGATKNLPDWVSRRRRRQDQELQDRIQLLQDFEFPEASNRVKVTPDGQFAMATGVYKPHIRVFDFADMSMKFARHTDAENVTFEILSDDWTKSVHLQTDRTIDFQTQGGIYYTTRIPRYGRDLRYHYASCDCYIAASGSDVYRLNLEQGRFLNPLHIETAADHGTNALDINPAHQLLVFGNESGSCEFWDPRARSRVGLLDVAADDGGSSGGGSSSSSGVTAVSFAADGLSLGAGTSQGYTLLYDLRSPRPLLRKDQGYGEAVKNIIWLDDKILTADKKIIKLWDRNTGAPFASVEPTVDLNDVTVVPGSGLIMTANEGTFMHAYFIPQLGPAPRWCSFLESLTEEMEENPNPVIYDNFKFVSRQELASLGLGHLVGTNVVRPYMHGFFIDSRLYERARLIANPYSHEEHRERMLAEKMAKQRESKIRQAARPKVNAALADRLQTRTDVDTRFANVFDDPDFKIDEKTVEFQQLNPTRSARRTAVEEMEAQEASSSSSDDDDDDDDDETSDGNSDDSDEPTEPIRRAPELRAVESSDASRRVRAAGAAKDTSFAARLQSQRADNATLPAKKHAGSMVRHTADGGREVTFSNAAPPAKAAPPAAEEGRPRQRERRTASRNYFRNM